MHTLVSGLFWVCFFLLFSEFLAVKRRPTHPLHISKKVRTQRPPFLFKSAEQRQINVTDAESGDA